MFKRIKCSRNLMFRRIKCSRDLNVQDDCIQAGLNTLVGWGLQMFMKVLGLVSYMEEIISDPSEICTIPKL